MDGLGCNFLADAALARDEDREIGLRDPPYPVDQPLGGCALAQDILYRIPCHVSGLQTLGDLPLQLVDGGYIPNHADGPRELVVLLDGNGADGSLAQPDLHDGVIADAR